MITHHIKRFVSRVASSLAHSLPISPHLFPSLPSQGSWRGPGAGGVQKLDGSSGSWRSRSFPDFGFSQLLCRYSSKCFTIRFIATYHPRLFKHGDSAQYRSTQFSDFGRSGRVYHSFFWRTRRRHHSGRKGSANSCGQVALAVECQSRRNIAGGCVSQTR